MAYLENSQHDVFVSYTHVDNLPDREGERGWVEELTSQLRVRLLKRLGDVDVWRDPKLDRAQAFDQVLEKAVRGSGILLCLISGRYLESEYCARELEWFRQQAETGPEGLMVGDYRRVFPVLIRNIPPARWPDVCAGTLAFCFHDGEGDELGEPLDPEGEAFEKSLRLLVKEIQTVLEMLRARESAADGAATENGSEAPPAQAFEVFLSEPADDLRPTRRLLAGALRGEGFEVAEEIPPPYEPEEHAGAAREAIARADLSIHLLGVSPGEPLAEADASRTYPLEQTLLGLEHARSQLILIPEEADLELVGHAPYAELLRDLDERQREAEDLEVVRIGRHQMLDEILAKRRRLERAAQQAAAAEAPSAATAFVDLHAHDVPHATALVGYLAEKGVMPVMIPSADLRPTAGMSLFEDNLRQAELFIVVFGTVARAWVEHRLQEAFKLILGQQLDTRIGVYVAPPRKPEDQVKFPGLFDVALNMDRFDPQTLEPLLGKIAAPAS